MSLSPFISFQSRFVTYLLTYPRILLRADTPHMTHTFLLAPSNTAFTPTNVTTMAKLCFRLDGHDGARFACDTPQLSWLLPDGSSPLVMKWPCLYATSETGLFVSMVNVFLWHSTRIFT